MNPTTAKFELTRTRFKGKRATNALSRNWSNKMRNMSTYSVSKINVYLPRHVDFGDKNALLDQNFGFACST